MCRFVNSYSGFWWACCLSLQGLRKWLALILPALLKCVCLIRYKFCLIFFNSHVSLNPDSNASNFSTCLFQWYFRNTEHIDHFSASNSCSFSNARCGLGRFRLCSHLKDVCKENKPHNHEELTQALEPSVSLFSSVSPVSCIQIGQWT